MKDISIEPVPAPVSLKRPLGAPSAGSLKLALLFLAVVPAALIIRLISEYGVNVPFGDEWSMVRLFAKWNDHQLSVADLFRQHNEHRILFPKLIYIAFAQLTHWNLRAEMFFRFFNVLLLRPVSMVCFGAGRRQQSPPPRDLDHC